MSARGLGKGFGSLLPETFDGSVLLDKGERVQKIALDQIKPDPNQPRKSFDSEAIAELASSIKRHGILQPLVVTQSGEGYVIVAGERRYRAARKIGLSHVPVLVRTIEEIERLEIGLIENMQRVDLSPMEQAVSIARLNQQFSMDMHDIAARLGKAHTTIVNIVRLLQLPSFAQEALAKGEISEGHARSILALKNEEKAQKDLLKHIIKDGWSVRQAEAYVKNFKSEHNLPQKEAALVSNPFAITENTLGKRYGGQVKISGSKNKMKVTFSFKSNNEFTQFIDKLEK